MLFPKNYFSTKRPGSTSLGDLTSAAAVVVIASADVAVLKW